MRHQEETGEGIPSTGQTPAPQTPVERHKPQPSTTLAPGDDTAYENELEKNTNLGIIPFLFYMKYCDDL